MFIKYSTHTLASIFVDALNNKTYVSNANTNDAHKLNDETETIFQPEAYSQNNIILKSILLSLGKVISFSQLNSKGIFRKPTSGRPGKVYMQMAVKELAKRGLGRTETYTIPANKSKVKYIKLTIPQL